MLVKEARTSTLSLPENPMQEAQEFFAARPQDLVNNFLVAFGDGRKADRQHRNSFPSLFQSRG